MDEPARREELKRRGYEPGYAALNGVMHQLSDASYLECSFTGSGIALIRLQEKGRQAVEGWPTSPGAVSVAEVEDPDPGDKGDTLPRARARWRTPEAA